VYHGGFSTGLNIGEAINITTKSWIPFGLNCLKIYRISRERTPVFPIEWLIVENIKNLNQINLGFKEIEEIRMAYL